MKISFVKSYLLVSLNLILLLACGTESKTTNLAAETESDTISSQQIVHFSAAQVKNAGIETGNPELENMSQTLSLQGQIEVPPHGVVSLSFPLGGYLKSTKMLPGMRVSKGQNLAELEDMQFIQIQQDYLTAKEKLSLNQTEFERQRDLNASKASSDRSFQQARSEMETQRILMNALGQKLELIGIDPAKLDAGNIRKSVTIVSPINGFVSKVNINIGQYTAPTDILFELVDPRNIHLSLNVFEKDLSSLSVGQTVTAYSNSQPGQKFQAKIILITKNLDENRMAEVHCHFDKYNPALVPGMYMNGEVSITTNKAITVPEDAVVRWENKFYVFEYKGNENYEMIEVEPGAINNAKQQIAAQGIEPTTKIVTKNAYSLLMKIKNTEEEEG
jgi:cobalt-zinc-cadmium efflux system membrane fusion protein